MQILMDDERRMKAKVTTQGEHTICFKGNALENSKGKGTSAKISRNKRGEKNDLSGPEHAPLAGSDLKSQERTFNSHQNLLAQAQLSISVTGTTPYMAGSSNGDKRTDPKKIARLFIAVASQENSRDRTQNRESFPSATILLSGKNQVGDFKLLSLCSIPEKNSTLGKQPGVGK